MKSESSLGIKIKVLKHLDKMSICGDTKKVEHSERKNLDKLSVCRNKDGENGCKKRRTIRKREVSICRNNVLKDSYTKR